MVSSPNTIFKPTFDSSSAFIIFGIIQLFSYSTYHILIKHKLIQGHEWLLFLSLMCLFAKGSAPTWKQWFYNCFIIFLPIILSCSPPHDLAPSPISTNLFLNPQIQTQFFFQIQIIFLPERIHHHYHYIFHLFLNIYF